MRPAAREYFTVDLRGLRAALAARAAAESVTESDVLRSALVARLGLEASVSLPSPRLVPPGRRSCAASSSAPNSRTCGRAPQMSDRHILRQCRLYRYLTRRVRQVEPHIVVFPCARLPTLFVINQCLSA